jgi:hypothetical protein
LAKRNFAAIVLLLALGSSPAIATPPQQMSVAEYQRKSAKDAKKQQKIQKKVAKQQQKAQKNAEKAAAKAQRKSQKADAKANRQLHH